VYGSEARFAGMGCNTLLLCEGILVFTLPFIMLSILTEELFFMLAGERFAL
jgi:hypothetical protein